MKRDVKNIKSVSAYADMKRDTPIPLYVSLCILDDPLPFSWLRTYFMNSLFLKQKTNKNIRILYSLKYKHLEKNIFYEKINNSVVWNKRSGEQY